MICFDARCPWKLDYIHKRLRLGIACSERFFGNIPPRLFRTFTLPEPAANDTIICIHIMCVCVCVSVYREQYNTCERAVQEKTCESLARGGDAVGGVVFFLLFWFFIFIFFENLTCDIFMSFGERVARLTEKKATSSSPHCRYMYSGAH